MNIDELPPLIPSLLRKAEFNTESLKKSVYLQSKNQQKVGDPMILSKLLKEKKITMASLDDMDHDDLKRLGSHCKLQTTSKSKVRTHTITYDFAIKLNKIIKGPFVSYLFIQLQLPHLN